MAEESQFDWGNTSLKFVKVARWILVLALGLWATIFALDFLLNSPLINPEKISHFAVVQFVINGSEPLVNALKSVIKVPTTFHINKNDEPEQVVDLLPLIISVAIYMMMTFVKGRGRRLVVWMDQQNQLRKVTAPRPKTQSADGLTFSSTSTDKAGRAGLGRFGIKKEDERDKLLRELADVKKRLDKTKQRLAFLSVDIVGSTRIKVGQDPLASEHLFREYRLMLESIFKKFRYRAASWTPDGVMACFPQLDLAYGSAKELLRRLPNFNKEKNRLGFPIQVRCGLNAGEVHYDESTPLELLSSSVLDITGHLQKAAQPDSVLVTDEIHQELRDKSSLMIRPDDVDGYKVYQWSLDAPQAAAQAGGVAKNL